MAGSEAVGLEDPTGSHRSKNATCGCRTWYQKVALDGEKLLDGFGAHSPQTTSRLAPDAILGRGLNCRGWSRFTSLPALRVQCTQLYFVEACLWAVCGCGEMCRWEWGTVWGEGGG